MHWQILNDSHGILHKALIMLVMFTPLFLDELRDEMLEILLEAFKDVIEIMKLFLLRLSLVQSAKVL